MGYLRKSLIALLMWVGVVVWLLPFFNVWCIVNPVITITKVSAGEEEKIDTTIKNINDELKSEVGLSSNFFKGDCAGKRYSLTMDMTTYKTLSQARKQKVMQISLELVSNSQISSTNRTKIYNFIAGEDTSTSNLVRQLSTDVTADFADAYTYFKPFSGWVGIILGILSLAIFLCIGFTIIIDIAFITIPTIQWFLQSTGKNDKPKFVSLEAINAIKVAESGTTYKNPMGIYMGSKIKQLIALFICLLYLVSGKLYVVIAWCMDYFNGFLIQ